MISSLVVTVNHPTRAVPHVARAIQDRPEFELGMVDGPRIPVVLESPDPRSAEASTRWLQSLPSVINVDVVFVALDEPGTPPSDAARDPNVTP